MPSSHGSDVLVIAFDDAHGVADAGLLPATLASSRIDSPSAGMTNGSNSRGR